MRRTSSHTWLRPRGSRPVVGSSRKRICGIATRLAAMSIRRRMPPEYVDTCRGAASVSANASSSSAARSRDWRHVSPSRRATSTRFSWPVRSSSTDAYCPVKLTFSRTVRASRTTSWPSTRAVPASGRSNVARIRIIVVLPAPFGPSKPYTVPVLICKFTPSSARVLPNDFVSPVVSIALLIMSCVTLVAGSVLPQGGRNDDMVALPQQCGLDMSGTDQFPADESGRAAGRYDHAVDAEPLPFYHARAHRAHPVRGKGRAHLSRVGHQGDDLLSARHADTGT